MGERGKVDKGRVLEEKEGEDMGQGGETEGGITGEITEVGRGEEWGERGEEI